MGAEAMDLLYWRDLKQTGPVFGSLMLLLFSLTQFSVVSVIAYLALAALSATISFRVYKSVLQAVQKTDEGHPFKSYLDAEVCLSQDQMQTYAEKTQHYINSSLKELRRLFLVQDLVDSLKFAVLMWLLTYVGALFNGLTLLILAVVSMFSVPVVYEKYQTQIDQYLGLVRTHVGCVVAKIQEKIPGVKRKEEEDGGPPPPPGPGRQATSPTQGELDDGWWSPHVAGESMPFGYQHRGRPLKNKQT